MVPSVPPNPATVTACKRNCQAELRVGAYAYNVHSGTCPPAGYTGINAAADAAVTATTYCSIMADLTPNSTGRPTRSAYWSPNITARHEAFHVTEWTSFLRQAWPGFETTVEAMRVPFNCTVTSTTQAVTTQQSAIDAALLTLWSTTDGLMRTGAEDRAYADGKASYDALVAAICARARSAGWTTSNACPICH
jgi:hypothetical protein